MTERADPLHAAPPDSAGHQGVHGTPDQNMTADREGIGGETNKDPARGEGRGSWLPILAWLAVVLAVALFVVFAHQA